MKKIMSLLLAAVFVLALPCAAFAEYPKYLHGDKNYPLCNARMGYAYYLNRNSLSAQKHTPPEYIIAIDVVIVGPDADRGNTRIYKIQQFVFGYEFKEQNMYFLTEDKRWLYLDPADTTVAGGLITKTIGRETFARAYNMNFYVK